MDRGRCVKSWSRTSLSISLEHNEYRYTTSRNCAQLYCSSGLAMSVNNVAINDLMLNPLTCFLQSQSYWSLHFFLTSRSRPHREGHTIPKTYPPPILLYEGHPYGQTTFVLQETVYPGRYTHLSEVSRRCRQIPGLYAIQRSMHDCFRSLRLWKRTMPPFPVDEHVYSAPPI